MTAITLTRRQALLGGATLAAGANCNISATFKPTATGNRAANVTITDNAAGSPQNISLGGNGTDFTLEVGSGANCPAGGNCTTSATVTAGQSATYNLQVTPIAGFNGAVTLSSTGAPSEATSRETPSSVTPNGVSASGFTESVSTTAPSFIGPRIAPPNWPRLPDVRFLYVLFSLLALLLMARFRGLAGLPRRRLALAPALALVLIAAWAGGCATGGGAGAVVHHPGTPRGTYTVTVAGTSGGVSHTLNLTLTVN